MERKKLLEGTLVKTGTPQYFSERGLPLITQHIDYHMDDDGEIKGMLTMENYDKWYTMYIIHRDGTVESRFETVTDDPDDLSWFDHCVVPFAFHETAKNLGLEYDSMTFAMVCERFVSDSLDGDWTKLHEYLPKK